MKAFTTRVGALALVALGLSSLAPASAAAEDKTRVSLYFALGAGGQSTARVEGRSTSGGLDPTLGAGLRLEYLVLEYLAIGGMFEMGGYKYDGRSREADLYFDFDAWVKGRYVFDLGSLKLEAYLGLPFGLTAFRPDRADNEVGFNTGLLGGASLLFDRFALFAELGWRRRQFRRSESIFGIDIVARVFTNQLAMHFGATVFF
ncbi:MAG: hypothetical protein KF901_10380 [Myxococcales bacterium]|nr:hypothetical protein [Myxococcales bacterium]